MKQTTIWLMWLVGATLVTTVVAEALHDTGGPPAGPDGDDLPGRHEGDLVLRSPPG